MITQGQLESVIRWAITGAAMFAAGQGWISKDNALTLVAIVVPALAALAWGIYAHGPDNTLLAAARNLKPGEKIVLNSQEHADEIPHDKVVGPESKQP